MSIDDVVKDDPKKPYKAYAAAVASFFVPILSFWIADSDPFTAKEAGAALLLGLSSSGLTGSAAYAVKNPKKV